MKRFSGVIDPSIYFFLFSLLFFFGNKVLAQKTLAFPGAEGFSKYSKGGRGGKIIKVTNLEDSGAGSLRNALEAEGSRIVVFEMGGLIDLETPVLIENPYITVAGQTAPGDGIAIRGNKIIVATNNVVIRFLRVRTGDKNFGPENNWEALDGIAVGGASDPRNVFNVIIDHCSISWAIDEVFSIGRGVRNVTIQNSIIAEGLNLNKHPEGHHSKGIFIRNEADSISVLNNLMISNARRNPKVHTTGLIDIRNNVIYNPGDYGTTLVNTKRNTQKINLIHNFFVPGPNTWFEHEVSIYKPDTYNGKIYMEGNSGFDTRRNKSNWSMLDNKHGRESLEHDIYSSYQSEKEFPNNGAERKSQSEIYNFINNYIGASLPVRDQVDERLIKEFNDKEGAIIDSQEEVGGWPVYLNSLSAENRSNGIPDSWMNRFEIEIGEEHLDFDNDGYTNIEEYLNGTDPNNPNNRKGDIFRSNSSIASLQQLNFEIGQNFPNPFQSETKIRMKLPEGNSQVYVYDSIGRKVKTILNRDLPMGEYVLTWEPDNDLSSGIFFLKVIHEGIPKIIPITYIK